MKSMLVMLALLVSCPARADDVKEEAAPLTEHVRIRQMHREAMRIRIRYSLPEQELDEECCKVAQRWANRMAADSWMRHGGGEQIIARGYRTAETCFGGWMSSSGHRHWVLSRSQRCGWGCQKSKSGQWFWVGVYRNASPKTQEVKPDVVGKTCPNGVCRDTVVRRRLFFRKR